MTVLFDTHCHFDSLDDAREQLPRAYQSGVKAINVIGCDVETTQRSIDVVRLINDEREQLGLGDLDAKATMGLHPHEAVHRGAQSAQLESLLHEHRDLIAGIGETGFDFYYNHSDKNDQRDSFMWQIDLAKQHDLALVIHTRDAWEDTFALLDDVGWPKKTVLHCFTGGIEEATRCIAAGAYISISGIATFKNAEGIREVIASVPLDRLVCETDSPWLAPIPHRGKPNEPGYVGYVADLIAQIREDACGQTREEVFGALTDNGYRVFR